MHIYDLQQDNDHLFKSTQTKEGSVERQRKMAFPPSLPTPFFPFGESPFGFFRVGEECEAPSIEVGRGVVMEKAAREEDIFASDAFLFFPLSPKELTTK